MVAAFTTYCSLSKTKSIKGAVIMISYNQLLEASTTAKNLSEVIDSATNLLGDTVNKDNVLLLVSKVPIMKKKVKGNSKTYTNDEYINLIKNELENFKNIICK